MLTYRATNLAIVLSAALAASLATPQTSEAGCCLFDWMWGHNCCRPVSCCYQPCCPSPCGCPTGSCGAGGCATGQCGASYAPEGGDDGYAPSYSSSPCGPGGCGVSYRAPAQTVFGPWRMAPLRPTPIVVTPAIQSQPMHAPTPIDGPVAKRVENTTRKTPVVCTVSAIRERSTSRDVESRPVNAGWVPINGAVTR